MQPAPWQPDASNGGFAGSPGLGTDLFAIASQGGQAGYPARGEQKAPSQKNPIGILVLMGVAAISLVVIMILVVAAFT